MTVIRVAYLREFHFGDDAVLLAVDAAGLDVFSTALNHALGQGFWRLDHANVTHDFRVVACAADVAVGDGHVDWRLDAATTVEVIDKLAVMRKRRGPCHHYVDIRTPADTLVLSVDEYLEASWLTRPSTQ
jgi:hypothetical protein